MQSFLWTSSPADAARDARRDIERERTRLERRLQGVATRDMRLQGEIRAMIAGGDVRGAQTKAHELAQLRVSTATIRRTVQYIRRVETVVEAGEMQSRLLDILRRCNASLQHTHSSTEHAERAGLLQSVRNEVQKLGDSEFSTAGTIEGILEREHESEQRMILDDIYAQFQLEDRVAGLPAVPLSLPAARPVQ